MKKKIMCILLCVVMLASCLMSTGCSIAGDNAISSDSTDANAEVETTRTSVTLSLWVPCEEGTTEDALYHVEQAINEVTQAQFDTAIKLYAIPTAEYDETVKERIKFLEDRVIKELEEEANKRQEEIQAAQKGETLVDETTEYVNPNMDGDYSLVVPGATEYVPIEKNQLDIFLIRGYDDYKYYVENGFVYELDDELANNSKVLNNYIYPDFFSAIELNDSVYAVPNNRPIGETTYFLVNKDIVANENMTPEECNTINKCMSNRDGVSFLDDIEAYYPDYVPFYGDYKPAYWDYWNVNGDPDEFSVIASDVNPIAGDKAKELQDLSFVNVLAQASMKTYYRQYITLKEKGYINSSETVPEKFGIGFISSTAQDIAKYEDDYYIYVYEGARGNAEEYSESMFAVSSRTENLSRSMEIITYLNTDPTLRTILQYGVEDMHWKYDEANPDSIVQLDLSKQSTDVTYNMNLFDTGNVYMTYPAYGVTYSDEVDPWASSKEQNLASYLPVDYYFMTTLAENGEDPMYVNEFNAEWFESLKEISDDVHEQLEALTLEEFDIKYDNIASSIENKDAYKKIIFSGNMTSSMESQGYIEAGTLRYIWIQRCLEVYGKEWTPPTK